jgi:hypothetical protein
MNATQPSAHERVLTELAHSRGYALPELVDRLRAAGHRKTANTLLTGPVGGFGQDLDEVLSLTEEEMERLVEAFVETFIGIRR